jgi:phosphoribosyl-dephospho-CoA transferase
MLIKQLSDEIAVFLEAMFIKTIIITAGVYLDINRLIDIDMMKVEATN